VTSRRCSSVPTCGAASPNKNGEGETVGGIVVVRYGANANQVIQTVKQRLDQAMKSLPSDVKYTVVYDRSALIGPCGSKRSRKNCWKKVSWWRWSAWRSAAPA